MKAAWLLPAGCREKGGPEPVGSGLAGSANSRQDLSCFVWRQSNRQDHFGQTFFRQPGPAHFLFHTNAHFCLRKCLTGLWTFVYKCLVLNFETSLSLKEWLARLPARVNQPAAYLLVTGASRIESEMKADTVQVRSLAIEATGDFFRRKITPKIRLNGQWLERAGFRPGHRVQVCFEQPGTLTLRFLEQGKEAVS